MFFKWHIKPYIVLAVVFCTRSALTDEQTEGQEDAFEVEIEYADDALPEVKTEPERSVDETRKARAINFVGHLYEKGSRAPIANVTVYLKGTEYEAQTNAAGRFAFRDLPPQIYTVVIPTTAYEKVETQEEIRSGEKTAVTYYLEPLVYSGLEVIVRDKRIEKEVSRTTIKIEEANVLPGSGGDPVRVIEAMPGIARGGGGGSDNTLVIRGANAEDSKVYLDGHWIPMLFHFGGAKSVYNGALLKEFDVSTGGFTAEYGRATGGVVNLKSRNPRSDRWGGYVDLSMIDASAMVEGPITKDMGLALGVRRSTLDLIMEGANINEKIDGLNFTTYPVYYDYQGKWHYQIDAQNSISIDAYGLYDKIAFAQEAVDDADPTLTGKAQFINESYNGAMHYRYKNDIIESDFSPAFLHFGQKSSYGPYFLNWNWYAADIREDLRIKLGDHNTLAVGIQLTSWRLKLASNMVRPPKEGDVTFNFSNAEHIRSDIHDYDLQTGAYIQDEIEVGPLMIIPSVRFDHLASINAFGIGPRGAVRWSVVKPFVLKVAGGLYHRAPDADEYIPPFGNRDLKYERATHAIAGFEWAITNTIDLDVQGYYKYMDYLVTAIDDPNIDKSYNNSAKGYVYGGELLLRHNWTDTFFGWVSYSISRSMRNDGPNTKYRRFDMDQTHNLVAVASWQFARGWRLGGRFQLTSGEPYTEITGSVFNADNGTYLPIYDEANMNAKTRPMYHRLDLRLDKEWRFDVWVLHTYLDVQNVYYHKNPVATVDNYDFSEQVHQTDIPILPSIGVTAEF
ncbi:MAG: carboxypeptidase-like regulatory domain-containing protein [Myxococcota bacterium]|nr:carboxypeptidase-like regulatory domain-containing protein [Myxococcota bacterium]